MEIYDQPNRMLLACVAFNAVSTGVTACTFDGVAMHPMTAQTQTFATFLDGVQWFYLLESELPAAGTYTLTATVDGALGTCSITGICLYNVEQAAPEAEGGGNNTGSTSVTISITTLTDEALILDCLFTDTSSSSATPGAGQYLLADAPDGAATHRQSASWIRKETAGSTSTTWTTVSDNHVYASIAVAPFAEDGPALLMGNPTLVF